MTLGRALLLAAIRGYKRHVSPRKGFACAYRVHVGGCSCSTLGWRAISRYGAWRGLGVLRQRLAQCHRVSTELRAQRFVARSAQAGFIDCDLPCDGSCIDASTCSSGAACTPCDACEIASCLDSDGWDDCGNGWWRGRDAAARTPRRRRRRGEPATGEPPPSDDTPAPAA